MEPSRPGPAPGTDAPDPGVPRRRVLVLLCGLAAILFWQSVFFRHGNPDTTLASPYRLTASTGVQPWQTEFVYFLYYLDLYPVASMADGPREYSVEGARRLIAEQGRSLVMDRYWTIRYGEMAKTYLYLPQAWLKGRPARPRMLAASALGFTVALLALFSAFWSVGKTPLGVVLVLLMGSNPFQVNEVYANDNLFGWPITLTLLMLALHVPLIHDRLRRSGSALALALVSGVLLGTFREIRTEPVLVAGAVSLVYLTATRFRPWLRLGLVIVLAGAFVSTSTGWRSYFESKYREAWGVVKAAGGHTYDGPRQKHHFFWHAIWCGLGDFDQKYGYEWSDVKAYSYAWPILQRQGFVARGYPLTAPDKCCDALTLGTYWDEGRLYARTPQELDEYIEILREKVLRDIGNDPLWYATIVVKRAARILGESTPPSLAVGNGSSVSLPGRAVWGWLGVGVVLVLLWRRDWAPLKTVAFCLPPAGTALLVYSAHGVALYSIAHLVALALGLAAIGGALVRGRRALALWPGAGRAVMAALRRPPALRSRTLLALAGVGMLGVLALGAFWAVSRRQAGPHPLAAARADDPFVAILRLENETSNEGLTWVGDAVGELLATHLSAAGLRVLGPDDVETLDADLVWWGAYGVLTGSRERAVHVVADRSGARRVLVGRVRSAPEGLTACVSLLSPGPGEALLAEQCEPVDPERVFDASWELARRVLSAVGVAPAAQATFASTESFRLYVEGRRAAQRKMWGDAMRLLDASLLADPQLRRAELLRARTRARWDPLRPRTLGELVGVEDAPSAVAAMRAAVGTRPDSVEARVDLGRILVALELYEEAIAVLSPLAATPGSPPEGFALLAEAHSARGDLPSGYQAMLEYQRRSRLDPEGQGYLADHLMRWGELDSASLLVCDQVVLANCTENQRAARGQARFTLDDLLRQWRLRALRGEWRLAEPIAYRMIGLDDPRAAGLGGLSVATGLLFQGRSRLAGALAEEAAFRLAQQGLDPAPALRMAVETRLDRDDARGALELIGEARAPRTGDPRLAALETIALARAGRGGEAQAARQRLEESLAQVPGPLAKRSLHQLDGELALLRGDAPAALRSFSQAERLLSPRGYCGDHVPIWYGLARAHQATKNPAQAEGWLERVAGASQEQLCWPIPYGRALAQLGRLQAAGGRDDQAAASFGRLLALWGEGDLAAADTLAARTFLQAHPRVP